MAGREAPEEAAEASEDPDRPWVADILTGPRWVAAPDRRWGEDITIRTVTAEAAAAV